MQAEHFSAVERRVLLSTNGIGEVVVRRLEEAGFVSLHQLRSAGAEQVARQVCTALGSVAWNNRRRALARAIERAAQAQPTESSQCAWPV